MASSSTRRRTALCGRAYDSFSSSRNTEGWARVACDRLALRRSRLSTFSYSSDLCATCSPAADVLCAPFSLDHSPSRATASAVAAEVWWRRGFRYFGKTRAIVALPGRRYYLVRWQTRVHVRTQWTHARQPKDTPRDCTGRMILYVIIIIIIIKITLTYNKCIVINCSSAFKIVYTYIYSTKNGKTLLHKRKPINIINKVVQSFLHRRTYKYCICSRATRIRGKTITKKLIPIM